MILERPSANITVTHSTGATNIRKLYVREALAITGGSLTINYVPSPDSTPISAQFSAAVSISGEAALSVHTLQVDASRTAPETNLALEGLAGGSFFPGSSNRLKDELGIKREYDIVYGSSAQYFEYGFELLWYP